MLNINLNPKHIDQLIASLDLANGDTEYTTNISDTIKAMIVVSHNNISFSLITGRFESANIRFKYETSLNNKKTKIEFISMSSASGNGSNVNCYSLDENIIAYRTKAEVLIAITLIGQSMENLKEIIEVKLFERQIITKKLQAEHEEKLKAEQERNQQAHAEALKNFKDTHNVIADEKQAFELLTRLKKEMVGSHREYKMMYIKTNTTTIDSMSFDIVRSDSRTGFLTTLGNRISQKALAKALVSYAVQEA